MRKFFILIFLNFHILLLAQEPYTSGEDILKAIQTRKALREKSIFKNYPVRNVGPVIQGGRITDIAVNPGNTKQYYIAFASGGVFKTENNGITFQPVFDHQGTMTIGDLCLAPSDPEIIWVGTGENNSSRSSYAGSGLYKSTNGGETWQFSGLESIQHTGRIIIHPQDPEILWVAAMGNLYTHNSERGVYKTTDGGATWQRTLYINDSTGAIDLIMHPQNPEILWAATWERTRKAWNFKGHGPGSGIYKSVDGGISWKRTMEGIGNPEMAGRIGLDVSRSHPNVMYAVIDNQLETRKEKERKTDEFLVSDFIDMDRRSFETLDEEKLDEFLRKYGFPEKYTAKMVKEQVRKGKYKPAALADYLGDANTALFDTEIAGAEIYKSVDFGDTWEKTHHFWLEGVYYTYGYYFGEIRISPRDPQEIFVFGVPLLKSTDGGLNFSRIDTIGDVHADHQAMWLDPEDPDHVLLGNDGGLYVSYDGGAAWEHINNIPAGQFYTVNVDMEQPYNIYGGLQDNGVLYGSSTSEPNETPHWEYLSGGDGMFVIPDPGNSHLVYLGYQFGNYYRFDTDKDTRKFIAPKHDIGEAPLRYNWRTPLIMSDHNPDILYIGAQKVFMTLDQGEKWETISPDITRNLNRGNVPYSTITCLEESPLRFGLLYAGTDDGNVQVTRNGGFSWMLKNRGLPAYKWVSSLCASNHRESKIYLTLTGYREDDFTTYVYRSEDYGDSWEIISGNLENEPANVIIEDPVMEGLLYLGTDHGTYFSLDEGRQWHLMAPIPDVANYDMKVHPIADDLIIGTHGRSIYVLPLDPVRKLAGKDPGHDFIVFEPGRIRHSEKWGTKRYPFSKPDNPVLDIFYYVPEENIPVRYEIFNGETRIQEGFFRAPDKGFNHFKWNLKVNVPDENGKIIPNEEQYADPGKYEARFTAREQIQSVIVLIE